jgi:hypothetical protein
MELTGIVRVSGTNSTAFIIGDVGRGGWCCISAEALFALDGGDGLLVVVASFLA